MTQRNDYFRTRAVHNFSFFLYYLFNPTSPAQQTCLYTYAHKVQLHLSLSTDTVAIFIDHDAICTDTDAICTDSVVISRLSPDVSEFIALSRNLSGFLLDTFYTALTPVPKT